jgi:hypothetical protein
MTTYDIAGLNLTVIAADAGLPEVQLLDDGDKKKKR